MEWAAAVAHDSDTRLTIGTVYPEPHSVPGYPSIAAADERRQRAEQIVRHAAEVAHDAAPTVAVRTVVAEGHPTEELIARGHDCDLIVVGNHGERWMHRLFSGSVAAQVAAHASCPVAVVHGAAPSAGPIVVGVDGSPAAQGALGLAFRTADAESGTIRAIHSYQIPTFAVDYTSAVMKEIVEYCRTEALDELTQALAPWIKKYPHVRVLSDSPSGPAGEILVEASKSASVVIVGNRGLGGFRGLLLGSVSRYVVNAGQCPVLVFRE